MNDEDRECGVNGNTLFSPLCTLSFLSSSMAVSESKHCAEEETTELFPEDLEQRELEAYVEEYAALADFEDLPEEAFDFTDSEDDDSPEGPSEPSKPSCQKEDTEMVE
jgi:hypothetical protein